MTPPARAPDALADAALPLPPPDAGVRTAIQKRAQQPLLPALWSVTALFPALPLRFPVPPDLPPSPKHRYRSHYTPPDPATIPTDLHGLTDTELALRLIDFAPLEPVLAQIYRPSAKGQVPFHPVSLFLSVCLRREMNLSWGRTATLLAGAHGRGWRALCGFVDGQTPSASGLRYFFQAVGPAFFTELNPRFTDLLRAQVLLPERSTFPGDPPTRGVTVSQDGMLHPARNRPSCQLATDVCYAPLPAPGEADGADAPPDGAQPDPAPAEAASAQTSLGDAIPDPAPAGRRPCRAREKKKTGCLCTDPACQTQCARASVLDPEARFIHYAGHNHTPAGAAGTASRSDGTDAARTGVNVFGYRSVVDRILDDRFAVAWTVQSQLYSANTDERTIFWRRLHTLTGRFPDLPIGEWLDDAGVGYESCLDAIWKVGALRMVDIRADAGDTDPAVCLKRGYDGHGCPLCPHGYRLRFNGYDAAHRRAKYVCAQVCRREPRRENEPVAAIVGCPFLEPDRPLGQVQNVGRTFPDHSLRLAREIPYGSPLWKARYGRRNLSESRNGQMEGLGLKRMRSYGLPRNTQEVQLADFLVNLRTLGRLVRAATLCPSSDNTAR